MSVAVNPRDPDKRTDGEAPIEVVIYDPAWPGQFAAEQTLLQAVLAPWLTGEVEHIGSTAVPGLAAKPIIDLMAPVASLEGSRPAIAAAGRTGYVYYPYKAEAMHWLCKPSAAYRTHHLHLVPRGSALWRERIAFRDALRRDPALAAEYAELKLRLAARYRWDREAYTVAKEPFIRRVLESSYAQSRTHPAAAARAGSFAIRSDADQYHFAAIMPGPARAGLFIYAKDVERLARFYELILGASRLHESSDMIVVQSPDIQLVVHRMPPHIASSVTIQSPPGPRHDTALKFFFTVPGIAATRSAAADLGGEVFNEQWQGPGFVVCNARDPEGNIFQVRQNAT
jgi:GrpB-like predicted nucleotidyltransferase (UPF0157 family)/predicted enzyme related to lactoylglutathione lyase